MKASTTICRLVLSFLSQFFQSRRHFSSQAKDRSTTHRFGSTTKVCSSLRFTTSTAACQGRRQNVPLGVVGQGKCPGKCSAKMSLRYAAMVSDVDGVPRQLFLPKKRPLVLPVHLLCLAPLLGGISPVAGYVKLQDDGMVHHPVDGRSGGHGVGEDAFPLGEDQV